VDATGPAALSFFDVVEAMTASHTMSHGVPLGTFGIEERVRRCARGAWSSTSTPW
jgi:hypothetical protein